MSIAKPMRETINVFGPIESKARTISFWIPSTVETMVVTEVTPKTMPIMVSDERRRLDQSAASDSLISARKTIGVW